MSYTCEEYPEVTRVEMIDHPHRGRAYTNWSCYDVAVSFQDDGRTLKVFVRSKDE